MNDDTDDEDDLPGDPREQIAWLEARIETLAEDLERGRKIDLAAKVLAAGGLLWLLAGMFGIVGLGSMALLSSIAAALGGAVLLGSNGSSMQQIKSAVEAAEQRRTELIGAIEMRTVNADLETGPQPSGRWLH
jgi:hypothetical protein